jgi:hypothetical protein
LRLNFPSDFLLRIEDHGKKLNGDNTNSPLPFHSWGVKTASGLAKLSVAVLDAKNVR